MKELHMSIDDIRNRPSNEILGYLILLKEIKRKEKEAFEEKPKQAKIPQIRNKHGR